MNKKVGQLLKEVREEKGLSVKDVARDTNISLKFIIALENEDYLQFPGETFTIGFLKTYSDYLKLDSSSVMNLYKGEQLSESAQPLQDILDPTRSFQSLNINIEKNRMIPILLFVGLVTVIGLFAYFYESEPNTTNETEDKENITKPIVPNPSAIPDIAFVNQSVPENKEIPFMLTPDQGFTFSVSNQVCKIFIKSVKKTEDKENIATIGFNIFPEKKVYTFESKVGLESLLSFNNPELASLGREVKITTQAVTDNSAKILVKLGDKKQEGSVKPIGDVPIQVTLYYSKSSFSEFIIDGQTGESRVVSAGETKQLEARDRLEIKVMDGSAVDIVQNGKDKIKLGRARYVKKIYQKVQNPLDSTKFEIKESGE